MKDLLPTEKERRRLFIGVCTGLLVAAIIAVVGLTVPTVGSRLGGRAGHLWAFASGDLLVRGWVFVALAVCALLGLVQFIRWAASASRPLHVRVFRSLSRDEQLVVRLLARSDYGLTEGELSTLVPVSTQRFLHFIDRLVRDLRLAERSEPASGGAFWALTDKGREVAAANHLFRGDVAKA